MTSNYWKRAQRGDQGLYEAQASSQMQPGFEKTWAMDRDESGRFIIATRNLADTEPIYQHTVYIPNHKDKISWKLRSTCRSFDGGEAPQVCRVCNEGLFCDWVKRGLIFPLYVYDLRIFKIEGKEWIHSPKWLVLRKDQGIALTKLIRAKGQQEGLPDGECYGMVFEVTRIGENAPRTGNNFDYQGRCNMDAFIQGSPRASWYQEKARKANRPMAREDAAREFFAVPTVAEVYSPDAAKEDYLLGYVRRVQGFEKQGQKQQQLGGGGLGKSEWASPQGDLPMVNPQATAAYNTPSVGAPQQSYRQEAGVHDIPMASGAANIPSAPPAIAPTTPPAANPATGGIPMISPGTASVPRQDVPVNPPPTIFPEEDSLRGKLEQAAQPPAAPPPPPPPPAALPSSASPVALPVVSTMAPVEDSRPASPFDGFTEGHKPADAAGYAAFGEVDPPKKKKERRAGKKKEDKK